MPQPVDVFSQVPDQTGRVALVTGANSGVGYWTALHLARAGAHVVLGCRNPARAEAALADLRAAVPGGSFEIQQMDLADLESLRTASKELVARFDRLDLLVLNAGIALAPFGRTADGFESQFGANFLGHFALTGLLLPTLTATPGSRVVHVGSLAHRAGRIRFDDPNFHQRRYGKWRGYAQSKFANVVFMLELDRRLRAAGSTTVSVGGHPGASGTGIADDFAILRVPGIRRAVDWLEGKVLNSPEAAAGPSVAAATTAGLHGGAYFGPDGPFEVLGEPTAGRVAKRARSEATAQQLWTMAEDLTGVRFLSDG